MILSRRCILAAPGFPFAEDDLRHIVPGAELFYIDIAAEKWYT